MTMKIAIISEFALHSVNFGNVLQAYALNRYLRDTWPDNVVESLPMERELKRRYTNLFMLIYRSCKWLGRKCVMYLPGGKEYLRRRHQESKEAMKVYKRRLSTFLHFTMVNISMPKFVPERVTSITSGEHTDTLVTWGDLLRSDYNIFINGSDVVWYQMSDYIRREKMLDFQNKNHARKIAYAASFGRDYIPCGNRRAVRRILQDFDAISVREKSSIQLLESLGIRGAMHCCDSTLLLSAKDWAELEHEPRLDNVISTHCRLNAKTETKSSLRASALPPRFVFAYLLGPSREQVFSLQNFCRKHDMPLVSIPYTCAPKHDDPYGDYIVPACSPEEWIWLVHHADLIITDSFHGIVFSTIFKKKFFAVQRITSLSNIGNRLMDYLDTIGQMDKFCSMNALESLPDINIVTWNYEEIDLRLEKLFTNSKQYLNCAIMNALKG